MGITCSSEIVSRETGVDSIAMLTFIAGLTVGAAAMFIFMSTALAVLIRHS
jgi:hypothetical protein